MKHLKLFEQFEDDPFGEESDFNTYDEINVGDEVICINNTSKYAIRLDKIYVVKEVGNYLNQRLIKIKNEDNRNVWYIEDGFEKINK